MIYFTYLIKNNFLLEYKNMELWNVLNEQYKFRKPENAVERTHFLKIIAACQWVSECVIVKLSGLERPQKIKWIYNLDFTLTI